MYVSGRTEDDREFLSSAVSTKKLDVNRFFPLDDIFTMYQCRELIHLFVQWKNGVGEITLCNSETHPQSV